MLLSQPPEHRDYRGAPPPPAECVFVQNPVFTLLSGRENNAGHMKTYKVYVSGFISKSTALRWFAEAGIRFLGAVEEAGSVAGTQAA